MIVCASTTACDMDVQSQSKHRYPPSNYLSAAVKTLPRPGPGVSPQTVEIDAGRSGRYGVTFVVRPNVRKGTPAWFWGMQSSERITIDEIGGEDT